MEDSDSESPELDSESEFNSLLSTLDENTPAAPDLRKSSKSEEILPHNLTLKESLKSREKALSNIDDLLISSGVRLVLFLPIITVALFILAQTYRATNPEWWTESVSNIFFGLRFSKATYALALVVMIADLLLLMILHYLLWVTQRIFMIETEEITSTGVTFRSAHGYSEMKAVIEGSANQLRLSTSMMVFSTVFLALALNFSIDTQGIPVLIALSTGALLAGHSIYMVSNRTRMNTIDPWGLLEAFSPPIHPALLNKPFTDVIRAHVDPLLAVKVSKYVGSFSNDLQRGVSLSDLQEHLLRMLYLLRSGVIDEDEFHSSLSSVIDPNTIGGILNHSELGEETLDRLLMHARERCAPFFRLNDRLRLHLNNPSPSGIWFDVDMENLTLGQANLFAHVQNHTEETQDLILRVQTPDFRPNECVYRLRTKPQNPEKRGNATHYSEMMSLMNSSKIVWQSLIPSSMGDATVTVRLEDSSGNLISGRVLTAQVRPDLLTRLRMTTGAIFMFGATLAVISPILPFLTSLFGL